MIGARREAAARFAPAVVFMVLASAASAASLTVVNDTDSYVTVSVDGSYGCNTAGHTTCTIPVSEGRHDLRAVRTDNSSATTQVADIPSGGYRWTLSNSGGANNCAPRARAFEAKVDSFNARCSGARSVSQAALYQQCAREKAALAAEQNQICGACGC